MLSGILGSKKLSDAFDDKDYFSGVFMRKRRFSFDSGKTFVTYDKRGKIGGIITPQPNLVEGFWSLFHKKMEQENSSTEPKKAVSCNLHCKKAPDDEKAHYNDSLGTSYKYLKQLYKDFISSTFQKREKQKQTVETSPSFPLRKVEFGRPNTIMHRIVLKKDGWQIISPWHDLPLFGTTKDVLNTIVLTPRGEKAIFEVAQDEPFTPIKPSFDKGTMAHFARNVPFNYGFLPQTAFSKESFYRDCGKIKQRQIYIFDLSSVKRSTGDVYFVRPICGFLLADSFTEFSWHFVGIDATDPKGEFIEDIEDIEENFPRALKRISSWLTKRLCFKEGLISTPPVRYSKMNLMTFKLCKNSGDKPAKLGNEGLAANSCVISRVLEKSHLSWRKKRIPKFQNPEFISGKQIEFSSILNTPQEVGEKGKEEKKNKVRKRRKSFCSYFSDIRTEEERDDGDFA